MITFLEWLIHKPYWQRYVSIFAKKMEIRPPRTEMIRNKSSEDSSIHHDGCKGDGLYYQNIGIQTDQTEIWPTASWVNQLVAVSFSKPLVAGRWKHPVAVTMQWPCWIHLTGSSKLGKWLAVLVEPRWYQQAITGTVWFSTGFWLLL